jgi:hypothetical protein
MAEDDEEKEQDIGLRKEQYMLSNAPVEEGGRKPRVSKFSKFLAKLKDAFVGTDEAEDVVIVPRASSVDESAITNRCHSILYDYYDYWCESCKRSGSTCYKEMTEIRHSRMQLIRDKIPKSFPPGTNVPEGVPFLPDKKTFVVFGVILPIKFYFALPPINLIFLIKKVRLLVLRLNKLRNRLSRSHCRTEDRLLLFLASPAYIEFVRSSSPWILLR